MILNVFIGYDSREHIAYEVLKYSILKHASGPVNIQPIKLDEVQRRGFLTRPLIKNEDGTFYDPISEAPASTEFAISRFLAPLLLQTGIGVFMDCDMVFVGDIYDILKEYDGSAVQCVKHKHEPSEKQKMDGQIQTKCPRKNWSSFFLFNADHIHNRNLNLKKINKLPGRDLHAFCWLPDESIGALSPGWNWLVNVQDKPENLYNAHFTLGGPWFDGWAPAKHDDLWAIYFEEMVANT